MLVNVANDVLAELCRGEGKDYISQIIFDDKHSNDDLAVFLAPNLFVANFIKTRYSELFENAFEAKTGKKPSIQIETIKAQKTSSNIAQIIQNKAGKTLLNLSYNFDNFIVGDSNQEAFVLTKMVADEPGKKFNPIFIYGSTGLGKTHLLHSIGNEAIKKGLNVIYVTAEQFLNDFIVNVRNESMPKFKEKYRKCDVLLIDDVQFLASSGIKAQEEFFYTFNELKEKHAQIALTSDKAPKFLKGFEERLVSRFESGVLVTINPPELDTKIRIIKAKCKFDEVVLSDEIIDYIATHMGDNIREIEGAILSINAYSRVTSTEKNITLDFVKIVLKDLIKTEKENIKLEDITNTVSKELNIKVSEIKLPSKNKKIVEARRICIYLAKNYTQNSMPGIASYFSLKDHSAVCHNLKKMNELLNSDNNFKIKVEEIKNKLAKNSE